MVRKSRFQNCAQLVLELQSQNPQAPLEQNPKGLVEALADLLLDALRSEGTTKMGGVDEHQDHA
jgi:hypothetical protein